MDVIIRTVTKGIFPFILLLGFSIIFHGHLTPGGSFPGGAVVASGFALVAIAFGLKTAEKLISEETTHIIEGLVALMLAGLILYESFIRKYVGLTGQFFNLWSSPTVLSLNVAGGLMVMSALILVVFLVIRE